MSCLLADPVALEEATVVGLPVEIILLDVGGVMIPAPEVPEKVTVFFPGGMWTGVSLAVLFVVTSEVAAGVAAEAALAGATMLVTGAAVLMTWTGAAAAVVGVAGLVNIVVMAGWAGSSNLSVFLPFLGFFFPASEASVVESPEWGCGGAVLAAGLRCAGGQAKGCDHNR